MSSEQFSKLFNEMLPKIQDAIEQKYFKSLEEYPEWFKAPPIEWDHKEYIDRAVDSAIRDLIDDVYKALTGHDPNESDW